MKLAQLSGKELLKKLQRAEFIAIRQRGSHVRMEKRMEDKIIKLTIPMHPVLKKGTLHHILKDAGLSVEQLEEL